MSVEYLNGLTPYVDRETKAGKRSSIKGKLIEFAICRGPFWKVREPSPIFLKMLFDVALLGPRRAQSATGA